MTIYCLYIFDRYVQGPSFPHDVHTHTYLTPPRTKSPFRQTHAQALQLRLLPRLAAPHQTSKARQRRRRAPPSRLARRLAPTALDLGPVLSVRHALLEPAQHAHLYLWRPRRVQRPHQSDTAPGYTNPTTTTAGAGAAVHQRECGWCCVERQRRFAVR